MQVRVLPGSIFSTLGHKALASRSSHVKQTKHLQRSRQKKSTQHATMCKPAYRTNFFIPFYILTFMCTALSRNSGTCGLVAMTSASHAEGRQFDPGQVYLTRTTICEGGPFSYMFSVNPECEQNCSATLLQKTTMICTIAVETKVTSHQPVARLIYDSVFTHM